MHHGLRREENGRKTNNKEQTSHERVPISNALAYPTVEEQTNDFTNDDSIAETCLPRSGDLVCAVRKLLAVLALELRKAEEVVEKTNIVAFHDDTCAM